jgi:hypothetical protein
VTESAIYDAFLEKLCYRINYQQGFEEGRLNVAQQWLLELGQSRLGKPDVIVLATVESMTDVERLERMFDHLCTVNSWQEMLAIP